MAMTSINVRVNEQDKIWFDNFCDDMGMTISTAINMFIKAVRRDEKIPFELARDPYFTGANMRSIMKGVQAYERGEHGRALTFEELEAMENA